MTLTRAAITDTVIGALQELLDAEGRKDAELGESTALVGPGSVVDSLGLVHLIVDVEQRMLSEHGIPVTIADEKAMSQTRSPFQSVAALVEYAYRLAEEQRGGG